MRVCLCGGGWQDAARPSSNIVDRLSAAINRRRRDHAQTAKRNSGILDIILGMPDLTRAGR